MATLIHWQFKEHKIRQDADDKGDPLFCALDVCSALGHSNHRKALADLVDADDVTSGYIIDSKGRRQRTNFVNESGMYALIFGSRLQSAKDFKRWVTHDVLPSIRKTGRYEVQVKLAAFIGEQVAEWSQMFPPEYWAQLDRIFNIRRPDPSKRPLFYAGFVQLVYETFDGDIHDEMRRRVPEPQKQGVKQHQTLSLLGSERMRAHVWRHIGLMDGCTSSTEYRRVVRDAFGRQLRLPLRGALRIGKAA